MKFVFVGDLFYLCCALSTLLHQLTIKNKPVMEKIEKILKNLLDEGYSTKDIGSALAKIDKKVNDYSVCPNCKSKNIIFIEQEYDEEKSTLDVQMECDDCRSGWFEIHAPCGIEIY